MANILPNGPNPQQPALVNCWLDKQQGTNPYANAVNQQRNIQLKAPEGSSCFGMFRRRMQKNAIAEQKKEFDGAFSEHTWDLARISSHFRQSQIDEHGVKKSQGLTGQAATNLIQLHGQNILPPPKEIGKWELLFRQFANMLWVLLIGVSTMSLIQFFLEKDDLDDLWVSLIMYAMILVMCTLSWVQEMRARNVVRGFQNLLPDFCTVIRDGGQQQTIAATQLVIGDLVCFKAGQRVPADIRLLYCCELKLESSSITGESEPMEYQAAPVANSVNVFESRNVAFNGSLCVDGEGMGVVIRTGENTVIGQTAKLTTGQVEKKSRLEQQTRQYVKFLVCLAFSVGLTAFVIGGVVHSWQKPVHLLVNGLLVCAIGMVLCGLPATVTSILTLIAKKLRAQNVYVKRLDICEALGQVSIIGSDKTGTLTKNLMTVTALWHWDQFVHGYPPNVNAVGTAIADEPPVYGKTQNLLLDGPRPNATHQQQHNPSKFGQPIADMLTCMTVCNTAQFSTDEQSGLQQQPKNTISTLERGDQSNTNKLVATGNPSECAMLNYANSLCNIDAERQLHADVAYEVPFSSARKWHLKIVRIGRDPLGLDDENWAEFRLFLKGAPERVAQKCGRIATANGHRPFGPEEMEAFESAYHEFADGGHRVIGFAAHTFTAPADSEFSLEANNVPFEGLTFLGMCAIMDPPRDQTADAIRQCKEAGIKVFMITGDHQLTANAIARQIGLVEKAQERSGHFMSVHGDEIAQLTPTQWDKLVYGMQSAVFARTTPEQKLMIVEQCQKRGQIIAMTGDGVNDAPALKRADVGIAMGSGSEVAKQASDIVLVDDNFASIVDGIKEGFDNITKLLVYTMPHSFPQVWPIVLNFCLGFPAGITPLQILSIDLGTELLPGISMSKEPPEGEVMHRPPRPKDQVLASPTLLAYAYLYIGQIQAIGCFLSYCCVFWSYGINITDLWMSGLKSWQGIGGISATFTSNHQKFTSDQQLYIGRQACSAWQIGIVFGQFFHIWSARSRRASLFKNMFSNPLQLVAIVVELLLLIAYVYMPGLNEFLGGAPVPWQCWAVVGAFGIGINALNELRKWCIRNYPKSSVVQMFAY